MTLSTEHRVEFFTHDADALQELVGRDRPRVGTRIRLEDGVFLEVTDARIQRGVIETSILLGFVLQVASGVSVKVLGELLARKLKGKRGSLTVNGTAVTVDDAQAIESALAQPKEASSPNAIG